MMNRGEVAEGDMVGGARFEGVLVGSSWVMVRRGSD
jgi:hypothetical protein